MGQIDQFLAAFKSSLKAKNIIYKDLAKSLNLSESSVKRILASKSISLERIDEICRACDISFSEVCRNANFEEDVSSYTITKEQEKILAENPRQLHYFILLNEGFTPLKIEKMSIAGVGNAAAGTLAVNAITSLLTKEANKPATKGDMKDLLANLKQRYHPVKNLGIRSDGTKPFYDSHTQTIVYLNKSF